MAYDVRFTATAHVTSKGIKEDWNINKYGIPAKKHWPPKRLLRGLRPLIVTFPLWAGLSLPKWNLIWRLNLMLLTMPYTFWTNHTFPLLIGLKPQVKKRLSWPTSLRSMQINQFVVLPVTWILSLNRLLFPHIRTQQRQPLRRLLRHSPLLPKKTLFWAVRPLPSNGQRLRIPSLLAAMFKRITPFLRQPPKTFKMFKRHLPLQNILGLLLSTMLLLPWAKKLLPERRKGVREVM